MLTMRSLGKITNYFSLRTNMIQISVKIYSTKNLGDKLGYNLITKEAKFFTAADAFILQKRLEQINRE
jgi:hypothetical protein